MTAGGVLASFVAAILFGLIIWLIEWFSYRRGDLAGLWWQVAERPSDADPTLTKIYSVELLKMRNSGLSYRRRGSPFKGIMWRLTRLENGSKDPTPVQDRDKVYFGRAWKSRGFLLKGSVRGTYHPLGRKGGAGVFHLDATTDGQYVGSFVQSFHDEEEQDPEENWDGREASLRWKPFLRDDDEVREWLGETAIRPKDYPRRLRPLLRSMGYSDASPPSWPKKLLFHLMWGSAPYDLLPIHAALLNERGSGSRPPASPPPEGLGGSDAETN